MRRSKKYNIPISVRYIPAFWLQEAGQRWICKSCRQIIKQGTVCLEMNVRPKKQMVFENGEQKVKEVSTKLFLCYDCAKKLLEKTISTLEILENYGEKGITMLEEL